MGTESPILACFAVIALSEIAVVVALLGMGWAVPGRLRPWLNAAGGVLVLLLLAPAAAYVLVGLTIFVLVVTQRLGFGLSLATVIGGFVAYRASFAFDLSPDGLTLIGIAFAVPRVIHVLVDVRTGRLERPGAAALIQYLWFWPTIVIGPIHRFEEHHREQRRARWDTQLAFRGVERVLFGLFMVVVVANVVSNQWLGNAVSDLSDDRVGLREALASLEYGTTLYMSFAGWSSVAIGLAALLGHRVTENFDQPFNQPNIAAFWRGWHRSLTRFTTEYVYRPVVAQFRNHGVAVLATMVAIAVWHEFSGRYLAWAAYHAAGLVVHRRFRAWRDASAGTAAPNPLAVLLSKSATVVFVMLGFTFTRSATLGDALDSFEQIATGGWW